MKTIINILFIIGWITSHVSGDSLAYFNTDNLMKVYADGVEIGHDDNGWTVATGMAVPCSTEVIAIRGENTGGPAGILGSLGSGIITDESWKCTTEQHEGWTSATFDDSNWPNAVSYGTNENPPSYWSHTANINNDAEWIWTSSNYNDNVVFCRKRIAYVGYLNVDDKMTAYADGEEIGHDDVWTAVTKIIVPITTKVLAVKGINLGGPAGILGSLSNGLITDEKWKCSAEYACGWTREAFDDRDWADATSYGTNSAPPSYWHHIAEIADNGEWIWTSNIANDNTAYCRIKL